MLYACIILFPIMHIMLSHWLTFYFTKLKETKAQRGYLKCKAAPLYMLRVPVLSTGDILFSIQRQLIWKMQDLYNVLTFKNDWQD